MLLNYNCKNKYHFSLVILVCVLVVSSCKKEWLEEKSTKSLVVPSTLSDFQAMLDNDDVMNGSVVSTGGTTPSMGEISSDEIAVNDEEYALLPIIDRNAYTWEKEIYENGSVLDWNALYKAVFYANIVVEGTDKIERTPANAMQWDNCKGSALLYRSFAFYNLLQTFSKPYDSATATSDLGIPLKIDANTTSSVSRATVQQGYDQIIGDVTAAINMLPATSAYKTRPSKLAAHGLLSRIFLSTGNYSACLQHANDYLAIQNELLDYNDLDSTLDIPIPMENPEITFVSVMNLTSILFSGYGSRIDTTLYQLYGDDDLRKVICYRVNESDVLMFRGYYLGTYVHFGGFATDEIYLIKAECEARLQDYPAAMNTLNQLLEKRYRRESFIPYTADNSVQALQLVIAERRKELLFRGLRWTDLRRLNKEAAFQTTLKRVINGKEYILQPNSSRYTFAIPDDVVRISNLPQNER